MSKPFDDAELRSAYAARQDDSTATRGPDCPSPEALLAAVKGEGPEAERLQVMDHALRCPACRRELALLHAVSGVSAEPRRSALRLTAWQRFLPLAAAASLTLVVGIVGLVQWRQRADETMRAGGLDGPTLVAPAAADVVNAGPVTFTWRPTNNAIRYTLEVDASDGAVLFSTSTSDTTIVAPPEWVTPGEHRWFVRAHLDDGSERRSEVRTLRVR